MNAREQLAREVNREARWLDRKPTGQKVEFRVVIFFPWDLEEKKFKGERVYFFQ